MYLKTFLYDLFAFSFEQLLIINCGLQTTQQVAEMNLLANFNTNGFFKDLSKQRIPPLAELIITEETYVVGLQKVVCG